MHESTVNILTRANDTWVHHLGREWVHQLATTRSRRISPAAEPVEVHSPEVTFGAEGAEHRARRSSVGDPGHGSRDTRA